MSRLVVRIATALFFLLFAVAVTWPSYLLFNRLQPRVLGLPLSFAWPALWVVASCVVLFLLDRSEERAEGPGDDGGEG